MTITLGTNASSLLINDKLNQTDSQLSRTMTRLSSGLKINRALDDAAGLVISQNMEARIKGSNQAMANIQTAKNFLTIAEDGMVTIGEHMQRINDLLTNMANDTNDISSRAASVEEIIERLDEINRLSDCTEFNGRCMLDGSVDSIVVQLGPDSDTNSTLEISRALTDCHTSALALDIELPRLLDASLAKVYKSGSDYYKLEDDGKFYACDENGELTVPKTEFTDENKIAEMKKNGPEFKPTNENCRAYMAKIQTAIGKLAERRGLLGAYENRLDSSYDSLSARVESLEEAKSVYVDADVAKEATDYTKRQILEQMNVSLLTQSNGLQQLALSLLG